MAFLEDLGLGSVDMSGAMDTTTTVFVWLFIAIGIGVVIWFYMYISSFKHKISLYRISSDNSRKIVEQDKFRYKKDKQGTNCIDLFRLKLKLPLPPAEAISTTNKGKEQVNGYLIGMDEIIYIKDKIELKENVGGTIEQLKKEGYFKPLTSNQRNLLTNQFKLANDRMQNDWKQYILPVVGALVLMVVVVCLFVFWEDITKPTVEVAKINQEVTKQQLLILTQQKEMMDIIRKDIEILTGKKLPEQVFTTQPTPPN